MAVLILFYFDDGSGGIALSRGVVFGGRGGSAYILVSLFFLVI